MEFEHVTLGQKIRFGSGKAADNIADEINRFNVERIMVIAGEAERHLGKVVTSKITTTLWWDNVAPHVPLEVAEAARKAAEEHEIDLMVSVGGGSTTGLAKAIALTTGIPFIAVPTTYAGSEATNVWGLTDKRTKTTGVDSRVLAQTVVYDAKLSQTLPVGLSVASGLNGMAHCIDSLWAPLTDPINQALGLEGARALALALRGIVVDASDLKAREQALYGSYLAAVSFASAGSGLHHKICHVLGGTFNLPHAETHAIILPLVLALNAAGVPALSERLSQALGSEKDMNDDTAQKVTGALGALYQELEAPTRLEDYGFRDSDIPEAVSRILKAAPETNPVAVTEENMTKLLKAALTGKET